VSGLTQTTSGNREAAPGIAGDVLASTPDMRSRSQLLGALAVVGAATASSALVTNAVSGVTASAVVRATADRVAPPPMPTVAPELRAQFDLVELVNAERARRGLNPVAWHDRVAVAAQRHAADMAAMRKMQHVGSDGSDTGDRLHAAGFDFVSYAENVAAGFTDPKTLVAAWMGSDQHRRNILGPYTVAGVGVAAAVDGTLYWTLDLATGT
jgi:uncharacterized protein YkwD